MLCSCNDPIQNVGQLLDLIPLDFELVYRMFWKSIVL